MASISYLSRLLLRLYSGIGCSEPGIMVIYAVPISGYNRSAMPAAGRWPLVFRIGGGYYYSEFPPSKLNASARKSIVATMVAFRSRTLK